MMAVVVKVVAASKLMTSVVTTRTAGHPNLVHKRHSQWWLW
jgi:hypothetical protein